MLAVYFYLAVLVLIGVVSVVKAEAHLNYLKSIRPGEYGQYYSVLADGSMNASLMLLGLPWYQRYKKEENERAAHLAGRLVGWTVLLGVLIVFAVLPGLRELMRA